MWYKWVSSVECLGDRGVTHVGLDGLLLVVPKDFPRGPVYGLVVVVRETSNKLQLNLKINQWAKQ